MDIISLPVVKSVLQKQSHSASPGKLQTLLLRGQWSKNSLNYPVDSKFAAIPPDSVQVEKDDCARTDLHLDLKQQPLISKAMEQLIILSWPCSNIKKKDKFSHNHM